jgi:hypothetical protein
MGTKKGTLGVNLNIDTITGELTFRAGRASEDNEESPLPIQDHEAIIEMTERFLEIAKKKLEEEKMYRVTKIKIK